MSVSGFERLLPTSAYGSLSGVGGETVVTFAFDSKFVKNLNGFNRKSLFLVSGFIFANASVKWGNAFNIAASGFTADLFDPSAEPSLGVNRTNDIAATPAGIFSLVASFSSLLL